MDVAEVLELFNYGNFQKQRKRSYDSLCRMCKYKVSEVKIRESEYGIRVVVFFNFSTEYVYLPPRYSRKLIDSPESVKILNEEAIAGTLLFQFHGWDEDDGQARFYFSRLARNYSRTEGNTHAEVGGDVANYQNRNETRNTEPAN